MRRTLRGRLSVAARPGSRLPPLLRGGRDAGIPV